MQQIDNQNILTKNKLQYIWHKARFLLSILIGTSLSIFVYKTGGSWGIYYAAPVAIYFIYLTNHSYKFGWNEEYRNKCLEYINQQQALPKEQRDGYGAYRSTKLQGKIIIIFASIVSILILINYFFTNQQ